MGSASSHLSAARAVSCCRTRAKCCRMPGTQNGAVNQGRSEELEVEQMDQEEPDDLPGLETVPECGICGDGLEQSLLDLECGHVFCEECVENQLRARWPGSQMTFGYLNCALCRTPMKHNHLEAKLSIHLELQERAVRVAVQKFQDDMLVEEMQAKLGKPATESETTAQAVREMAVFQCCDCREPYCAGRMNCAAVLDHDVQKSRCPDCTWATMKDTNDHRCLIHGPRFAMFKCDSCCNVAVWNCTSHHYCERCHDQAHERKHYPCPGPELCPLGMLHPPNGEAVHCSEQCASFCIGCTACLGHTEAQDVDVNDSIALGFDEMWLRFESGEQVLALLGEKEVRTRLRSLQPGCINGFKAKNCAEQLLELSVTKYKEAAAARRLRQEHPDKYYQLMERQGHREYMEMERMAREQEEEMRLLSAEVDKERKMPAFAPDWKMLREEKRAKHACRSYAAHMKLDHKHKRVLRKQGSFGSKSALKIGAREASRESNASRALEGVADFFNDIKCQVEAF